MKKYIATNKKEFLGALYDILDNRLSGEIFCNVKSPFSMAYRVVLNEEDNDVKEVYCSSFKPSHDMTRHPLSFDFAGFYCKGEFVEPKKILPTDFFDDSEEIMESFGKNPSTSLIKRELHEKVLSFVASKYPSLEALEEAGLSNVVSAVKNMDWDITKIQADLISQNGRYNALRDKYWFVNTFRFISCWWPKYKFPIPVLVKVSAGVTPWETLIQLVLDKYKDCMNDNNAYWEMARRYMYEKLIPKAQATLTEEQKTLVTVIHDLAKKCWKESSYITIRIQGRDSLLSEYTRDVFPDFSIEGKEVVVQRPLCSFRNNPLKIDYYDGAKFQPKLKREMLPCPLINYIEEYSFEDILSISYRGKKYYQKQTAS